MSLFDEVKSEFPILKEKMNEKPLAYFDNAATVFKPLSVVEAIREFDLLQSSNVHRGVHQLSQKATSRFEEARKKVQKFLNADSDEEIIFTSGTTDSVNLLAFTYGERFLREGDEIILSQMEHHSNIVPWQMLSERKKIKIRYIPLLESGDLDFEEFKKMVTDKTRLLSITMCSNTLGTVNNVNQFIDFVKDKNIHTHLDAAQAVNAFQVDVKKLNCDFLSFSGHKMFGPFGIGVLYGRKSLLNELPPYKGGGSMIKQVYESGSEYDEPPQRFEAGTPNISGAIGLGAAIDFINNIGFDSIHAYENQIYSYMVENLKKIQDLKIIGDPQKRIKIASFIFSNIHHTDMASLMDQEGVAVRSGRHCTNLIMLKYGIKGTIRASVSIYNNEEQVDQLVNSIIKAKGFF